MDFKAYYNIKKEKIEAHLEYVLSNIKAPINFSSIMAYPLKNGGKRIRPVLSLMIYDALTEKQNNHYPQDILNIACAIELIHTYSLVHDDLPSMDNDDLRRGEPTTHIKYGEAMAILSGDALLTYAFEILSTIEPVDTKQIGKIIHYVAKCAGPIGMIGGQVLDIKNENKKLSLDELMFIHKMKTAYMIEAPILSILYYLNETKLETALSNYGHAIGFGFQVIDDVLDVTQSTKELGKNANSDMDNHKVTYVDLLGIEGAMNEANKSIISAKSTIDELPLDSKRLKELADYVLNRLN